MRKFSWLGGVCFAHLVIGQVNIDVPVHFTGVDGQRTVQGLGVPAQADAMITVEGSIRSEWMWATTTLQVDTLTLLFPNPPLVVQDGLLLRFLAPADLQGPLWLRVPGQSPLALVRTDGIQVTDGQITAGQVCEVMHAGGRFYLLNAPENGCPSGYLQVNANYCIESHSTGPLVYYDAADRCALKGGRLCTWDEYQAACSLLAGQFNNMFIDWEWIDDVSNHVHTVNQVARTSCEQMRSIIVSVPARVRCCHHMR